MQGFVRAANKLAAWHTRCIASEVANPVAAKSAAARLERVSRYVSELHEQPDAQPAGRTVLQAAAANGRMASADGPIKTFPLRGIKDSPAHPQDSRLRTLDDTVELFNLILELKPTGDGKVDLVASMRVLRN